MKDEHLKRDTLVLKLLKSFKKKFPEAPHTRVTELFKTLQGMTLEELRQLSDEKRR